MNSLKIYLKKNLTDETFYAIDFLNWQNLRSEDKGLGAGTFQVLLKKYDLTMKAYWDARDFGTGIETNYTNWWVFVQDTSVSTEAPVSNSDNSIIWWGFIGEFTREIQLLSGDGLGTVSVYEFGHFVNKHKIRYNQTSEVNENGFNPIIDSKIVGNKDIRKSYALWDTFGLQKYGRLCGTDPDETEKYFTVKEAINYMVMRSIPTGYGSIDFYVIPDWSRIDTSVGQPSRWLEQYETIPSGEGMALTDAIDQVLDTIGWTYYINEDNNIVISFFDRNETVNINEITLDSSCESFSIMQEQQSYNGIKLIGDRILYFNALTSYSPMQASKSIGVFPNWTDEERLLFVSPKRDPDNPLSNLLNDNIDVLKAKSYITKGDDPPLDPDGGDIPDSITRQQDRAISEYKTLRQAQPKVYQDFVFGYCNPNTPANSGSCLCTWRTPGAYGDLLNSGDAASKAIPAFPFCWFQDALDVTKKPSELIFTNSEIEQYLDAQDARSIPDRLLDHQTPAATEMKYSDDTISILNKGDRNFKPTFYYRTYGFNKVYDNGTYPTPLWIDGTKGGDGLMSSQINYDYDGVKLDSDEPEVFAAQDNAIYQSTNVEGNIYTTTVKDWGMKRDEWKDFNVGASKFDPYRNLREWATVTHWGRFVFAFGAYSSQRVTMQYGEPDADRMLQIDDSSYQLQVARPGYVYDVDSYGLKYNESNIVVKSDLDKMAERMAILWSYYSRDKKAVKLSNAMFNDKGVLNKPLGATSMAGNIGLFISNIINSDGLSYTINSYVSSFELDLNSDSPRILIQTEYPDSPRNTRDKRLMSVQKKRKYEVKDNDSTMFQGRLVNG